MSLSIAERWEIADRYFDEGSAAVDLATVQWDRAHSLVLAADFRRVAWGHYEVLAARARSLFRRGDAQLDCIQRDQAVLNANATTTR